MRALLACLLCVCACAACGDDEPVGDLAGTYMLDREVLAQDFLQDDLRRLDAREREALSAEQRRAMIAAARAAASESDMRLDLTGDGAFVIRFRFGAELGTRGGTWTTRGRQITLQTTKSADGPLGQTSVLVGQCADGLLRFEAGSDVPHPFTLRRR